MITSTHVITNALLSRRSTKRGVVSTITERPGAFVAGGLAPDIGLILLTAGAGVYFPRVKGWTRGEAMHHAFSDLFFNDWRWITIQNTFHSPVVLTALYGAGRVMKSKGTMAFALGSLLHTAMDIPVHHDDGPLVLFPLDWKTRIMSPVSYWDKAHYGAIVGPLDIAATVVGGAALIGSWIKDRRNKRA